MYDIMPVQGGLVRRTESRQLSRSLSALEANTSFQVARIEQAADVQATRVDAVIYVGRRAMQDIARLTQLEQQLALMAPMASGRLQAIGDLTSLAVTEIVTDTLRKVR